DSVAGQFTRQIFRILQSGARIDFELRHNAALDNFFQGSRSVGGLPDDGGSLVQREERGVVTRHDHHLAIEDAGRQLGTARYVELAHPINSQTRASGTKVRRETGTRFTNSKAE